MLTDSKQQRAADLIFGSGAPPPPPAAPAPARQPTFEPLDIDDTLQGQGAGSAPRRVSLVSPPHSALQCAHGYDFFPPFSIPPARKHSPHTKHPPSSRSPGPSSRSSPSPYTSSPPSRGSSSPPCACPCRRSPSPRCASPGSRSTARAAGGSAGAADDGAAAAAVVVGLVVVVVVGGETRKSAGCASSRRRRALWRAARRPRASARARARRLPVVAGGWSPVQVGAAQAEVVAVEVEMGTTRGASSPPSCSAPTRSSCARVRGTRGSGASCW